MAWCIKYYTDFKDIFLNSYRVEIFAIDYVGEAKEMELAEDAVTFLRPDKDLTEPLFSCGIKMHVWCNQDNEYEDLFFTADKSNLVVLYRETDVIFTGFIEQNLYEEEILKAPYTIVISASDNLSTLETITPTFAGLGIISFQEIITTCLALTGLSLQIRTAIGLTLPSGASIFTATVDRETLRDLSEGSYKYSTAKTLLEDILSSFNCRLYQANGVWYIERTKVKAYGAVAWQDIAGNALSINSLAIEIGNEDTAFTAPGKIKIDSGYGKLTINAAGEKFSSQVYNDFSNINTLISSTQFNMWYKSSLVEYAIPYDRGTRSYSLISPAILIYPTVPATTDPGYLYFKYHLNAVQADEVNLSFKSSIYSYYNGSVQGGSYYPVSTSYSVFLKVKIKVYKKDSNNNLISGCIVSNSNAYSISWGSDQIISLSKKITEYINFDLAKKLAVSTSISFIVGNETIEYAELYVYPIYGSAGGGVYVHGSCFGEFTTSITEEKEADNTFEATVNKTYSREADDKDIRFWNLPNTDKTGLTYKPAWSYKNGIFDASGAPFAGFAAAGEDSDILPLHKRIFIDLFDQYYNAREVINGTVQMEDFISPEQLITVNTRTDKKYILTSLSAKLLSAEYTLNLSEIKPRNIILNE